MKYKTFETNINRLFCLGNMITDAEYQLSDYVYDKEEADSLQAQNKGWELESKRLIKRLLADYLKLLEKAGEPTDVD